VRRNPAADVRRIAAHRRLLAVGVLAATLVAGAFLWLRDSSLVRVENVTVLGAGGPEAPRVRAALTATAKDMTTLHVRVDALREAVQSFPTVKDVRVERDLLHGLKIIVVGRPAVAAIAGAGSRLAVAADGTLLRGAQVPNDVPSLKVAVPPGGPRLADPRAVLALALIAAAPPAMRAHVQRAYMGPEGLEAALRDGPSIIAGDGRRLRAKWVAAARVLSDPGARGARYVDVRVPERAVAGGLPQPAQQVQPSTTG
jgi:cell division protein FtsQ